MPRGPRLHCQGVPSVATSSWGTLGNLSRRSLKRRHKIIKLDLRHNLVLHLFLYEWDEREHAGSTTYTADSHLNSTKLRNRNNTDANRHKNTEDSQKQEMSIYLGNDGNNALERASNTGGFVLANVLNGLSEVSKNWEQGWCDTGSYCFRRSL